MGWLAGFRRILKGKRFGNEVKHPIFSNRGVRIISTMQVDSADGRECELAIGDHRFEFLNQSKIFESETPILIPNEKGYFVVSVRLDDDSFGTHLTIVSVINRKTREEAMELAQQLYDLEIECQPH